MLRRARKTAATSLTARDAGRADEQTPARAPAHGGNLVMFEETQRLSEDGAAGSVPLDQRRLRPQQISGREVVRHHVLQDGAGHVLGSLVAHPAAEGDVPGQDLPGAPAVL